MNTQKAIYIIESGKALDLIKDHIEQRIRVRHQSADLLKELGMEKNRVWTDTQTGVVKSIEVKRGAQPQGFTAPDSKGRSWPKKGTDWEKRFAAQVGYTSQSTVISEAFNVPLSLEYTSKGGGTGWSAIGFPLSECGFLFMSHDGPYAMWIPDVEKIIQDREENGDTVTGDAKKFSMYLEGCRRIEEEEWEIMVMQHKLDQKLAEKQAQREAQAAATEPASEPI